MNSSRLVFAAALLLALSARANPCKEDAARFCQGVRPGGGRIIKCLKEHEAELSEACRAMGAKMKERAEEVIEACKGDAEQFCKDVKPGNGRIRRCLRRHRSELSPSCKEAYQPGPRRNHTTPGEKQRDD